LSASHYGGVDTVKEAVQSASEHCEKKAFLLHKPARDGMAITFSPQTPDENIEELI